MERARAQGTIGIVIAAAFALGGCALTISGPASNRPRGERPSCDTGKGFVATDAILGSVLGVATLAALGADAGEAALLPGVFGAAFILSAVSGNGKANDCRAAMDAYEAELRQRPLSDEDEAVAARRAELRGKGEGGAPALPASGRVRAPGAAGKAPGAAGKAPGRSPAVAPPDAGPPAASPPDAGPPAASPPDAGPPVAAPPDTAPPAASPPPQKPSPQKPPPRPQPAPPPAPDRWNEFWKELP